MKYQNPILPGFNPDPSIVLHPSTGTFYLVTSSFHLFPGLPIYASRDLQKWTQIGNAIFRPSQLPLAAATTRSTPMVPGPNMVATAGLWAPTIRFHALTKMFYVLCTNCVRTGAYFTKRNFYITCHEDKILEGGWSDPAYFDFDVIDPSIFFNDGEGGDGRVYIQGCVNLISRKAGEEKTQPSCTLMQVEVEVETGKIMDGPREIWAGFAKIDTEGPHIYKKDGWYYLLAAEGGTFEHHLLSISRSRDIWGPFEGYEKNPIMTADGKDEYVQNCGHGDLFQDANSAWWAVVLAVRNEGGRQPLGRETFLTPVIWPENGWPEIAQPKMDFERERVLVGSSSDLENYANPMYEMVYIREPIPSNYQISPDTKTITLKAGTTDLSSFDGVLSFVGKRQTALSCIATATLILSPYLTQSTTYHFKAGLTLYKDSFRYASIYLDSTAGKIIANFVNGAREGGEAREESEFDLRGESGSRNVDFRIVSTEEKYVMGLRREGEGEWCDLLGFDAIEMTARDFTGTLFGVFATGDEETKDEWVRFEGVEQVIS